MGISSSYMERVVALSRKVGVVRVFCFMCLLLVGSVHAQVIVSDPILEGQSSTSNATQALQWGKQVDQYLQEVQQYQALLMTVEGLGSDITLTPNTLQKITDTSALITQNCPGATGVTGIISSITGINLGDPILTSQRTICANIVTVEVDEYNRTVDVINQLQGYSQTLQKLNQLAATVQSLGNNSAATVQATTFNDTILQTIISNLIATLFNIWVHQC